MATDLNMVGLVGRLTRPCENRFTNNGFCITTFSLAVNRRQKDSQGNWSDKASFFDVKILGKMGESLSQYLVKGQQVSVKGYLDQESWESNGQKRSKVVVIAESVSLLGSNQGSQGAGGQRQQTTPPRQNYKPQGTGYAPNGYQQSNSQDQFADDIPFD